MTSEKLESVPVDTGDQRTVRVLVNGRPLSTVFTGVARYTRSLYESLCRLDGINVDYFVGGRTQRAMPEQSKTVLSSYFPVWMRRFARNTRLAVEGRRLQRYLDQRMYDVYHETGLFPITVSNAVPKVLTIYDLSLLTYKHCHPPDRVEHFERYFYDRLSMVDHIITISDFVRHEILDSLDVAPDRVSAVPLAASPTFHRRTERAIGRFLETNNLPNRYILTVGTREPRKNLIGLIRAYARIDTDLPLLCVGWSGWMSENVISEISKLHLQDKVKLLGHVSDEELAVLYSGARVMVYPSFYEGFGLPILEAMACGCPVVCSNTSSMPEVAGGAAILADPEDTEQIIDSVSHIIDDDTLRQRHIKMGQERAKAFTWERTARGTLAVFQKVANNQ